MKKIINFKASKKNYPKLFRLSAFFAIIFIFIGGIIGFGFSANSQDFTKGLKFGDYLTTTLNISYLNSESHLERPDEPARSYESIYNQDPDRAKEFMDESVLQIRTRIDNLLEEQTNSQYEITYSYESGIITLKMPNQNYSVSERRYLQSEILGNNVLTFQNEDKSTVLSTFDLESNGASVTYDQSNNPVLQFKTNRALISLIPDWNEAINLTLWKNVQPLFEFYKYNENVEKPTEGTPGTPSYENAWLANFVEWCSTDSTVCGPDFLVGTVSLEADEATKNSSLIKIPFDRSQEEQAKKLAESFNSGVYDNLQTNFVFDGLMSPQFGSNAFEIFAITGLSCLAALSLFLIIWYRLFGMLLALAMTLFAGIVISFYGFIQGQFGVDTVAALIGGIFIILESGLIFLVRMRKETRKYGNPIKGYNIALKRSFGNVLDLNLSSLIIFYVFFIAGFSMIKGFSLVSVIIILVNILMIAFLHLSWWLLTKILYIDNQSNYHKWLSDRGKKSEKKIQKSKKAFSFKSKLMFSLALTAFPAAVAGISFFSVGIVQNSSSQENKVWEINAQNDFSENLSLTFLVKSDGDTKNPVISIEDFENELKDELGIKNFDFVTKSGFLSSVNPNSGNVDTNNVTRDIIKYFPSSRSFIYQFSLNKNSIDQEILNNLMTNCAWDNSNGMNSNCPINNLVDYLQVPPKSAPNTNDIHFFFTGITDNTHAKNNIINFFVVLGIVLIPSLAYISLRFSTRFALSWLFGLGLNFGSFLLVFSILQSPVTISFVAAAATAMIIYNILTIKFFSSVREKYARFKKSRIISIETIRDSINKGLRNSFFSASLISVLVLIISVSFIGISFSATQFSLVLGMVVSVIITNFVVFVCLPWIFYLLESKYQKIRNRFLSWREKEKKLEKYIGLDEQIVRGIND